MKKKKPKNFFQRYSLSIVLFILFFVSWIGQFFFQWQEFASMQEIHSQDANLIEFIPEFLSATFENWQSEFLQLFAMVVLTAMFIHVGSHESRDTDDEFKERLERIEEKIDKL